MKKLYDIFISYKRQSLPTANNLYYRLTTRGYSTFFDLEEMRRDNFNVQLLNCIENAKDIFVILEDGSLDACKDTNWEKDWFCREIAFALEKKKNIIPILIGNYKMPPEDFFPDKLKELSYKNAPEFNFSFFDAYLDKLIEKDYILSKPDSQEKNGSVFKFYSSENCQIFKEGELVCCLEGKSDEPYYLPVPHKGDYRFKVVNSTTKKYKILNEVINDGEEKNVEIRWKQKRLYWLISLVIPVFVFFFLFFRPDYSDNKIREFIELYRDATNNNNISEIETLYALTVKRFYDSYNISRDSVVCNYKNYESYHKAHNPQSAIQWETLQFNKMKDGFIQISFIEYYSLDRDDADKYTMWILEKHFVLDNNYKIVKEYERQLQKGKL